MAARGPQERRAACGHRPGAGIVGPVPSEEVKFVAEAPDGTLLGGVRLVRDRDGDGAEFAISVASRAKRAGLGRLLMETMLRYARTRPLAHVHGDVLHENVAMHRLARCLGFHLETLPKSAGFLRATLTLR